MKSLLKSLPERVFQVLRARVRGSFKKENDGWRRGIIRWYCGACFKLCQPKLEVNQINDGAEVRFLQERDEVFWGVRNELWRRLFFHCFQGRDFFLGGSDGSAAATIEKPPRTRFSSVESKGEGLLQKGERRLEI